MSGQKSSRWFMFSHSYTSSRKTHSLLGKFVCEWVCAKKQIPSAMFTESFCFIPAHRSGYLLHEKPSDPLRPPMGRNRSSFPLGTRHVPQMRPWRWRSAGLSYSTTERIKSQIFSATKQSEVQKQSKHYSSYFLPTNVWL